MYKKLVVKKNDEQIAMRMRSWISSAQAGALERVQGGRKDP